MADSPSQQASFAWVSESDHSGVDQGQRRARRGQGRARPTVGAAVAAGRGGPAGGMWLTADEATAYLGLPTRKALYAAVARGQVPARRLGRRRLRFNRVELDALLGGLAKSTGVH